MLWFSTLCKSIQWRDRLLTDIYTERLSFFDIAACESRVSFLLSRRAFVAMPESLFQAHLLFNFAAIQAQVYAADTVNYFAARANTDQTGKRLSHPSRCVHTPKVITGRLKTLCLPHLGKMNDITSALLIRRESLWDTYYPVLTYDGAGPRRSRPSRVVAIRQFPKEETRRLIGRFGQLEHKILLLMLECYLDGDSAFVLVDDLALTLGHIVACLNLRLAEFELGCLMAQVGGLSKQLETG